MRPIWLVAILLAVLTGCRSTLAELPAGGTGVADGTRLVLDRTQGSIKQAASEDSFKAWFHETYEVRHVLLRLVGYTITNAEEPEMEVFYRHQVAVDDRVNASVRDRIDKAVVANRNVAGWDLLYDGTPGGTVSMDVRFFDDDDESIRRDTQNFIAGLQKVTGSTTLTLSPARLAAVQDTWLLVTPIVDAFLWIASEVAGLGADELGGVRVSFETDGLYRPKKNGETNAIAWLDGNRGLVYAMPSTGDLEQDVRSGFSKYRSFVVEFTASEDGCMVCMQVECEYVPKRVK